MAPRKFVNNNSSHLILLHNIHLYKSIIKHCTLTLFLKTTFPTIIGRFCQSQSCSQFTRKNTTRLFQHGFGHQMWSLYYPLLSALIRWIYISCPNPCLIILDIHPCSQLSSRLKTGVYETAIAIMHTLHFDVVPSIKL